MRQTISKETSKKIMSNEDDFDINAVNNFSSSFFSAVSLPNFEKEEEDDEKQEIK